VIEMCPRAEPPLPREFRPDSRRCKPEIAPEQKFVVPLGRHLGAVAKLLAAASLPAASPTKFRA